MTKKLAVAVIHGMGSQGVKRPSNSDEISFSKELYNRVRRKIKPPEFDENIAWREIFWADILQSRQQEYYDNIKRQVRSHKMRNFVLANLGDAAGYRKTTDANDQIYVRVHDRVNQVISELEDDVQDDSMLVVIAHSLGGHVMSNYIYDMSKNSDAGLTDFRKMKSLAVFVTFGCNIPVFTFAYPQNQVFPITFPGTNVPADKRLSPWWSNYYDKDDVLGYPLARLSDGYAALHDRNELCDYPINSGGMFASWNPMSHNGYWKDSDFVEPVARLLKQLY
ncbi:MAG: hypothetical protein GY947_23790 [Rhodobacteraceae bacterium]|nr:hypothetical protein [Paracoccaceae bacterium]